jgi:hypothetical protein
MYTHIPRVVESPEGAESDPIHNSVGTPNLGNLGGPFLPCRLNRICRAALPILLLSTPRSAPRSFYSPFAGKVP